jgi:hypothetical protein
MEQRHWKCKTTIYKVYFKTILLHGAETWTCIKRDESKIQMTDKKFLTARMEKTKTARIRNADIREELRMEDKHKKNQRNRL